MIRLAALLIAGQFLDATSFAALAGLPSVAQYELNPILRAELALAGPAGVVAVKLAFAGAAALLILAAGLRRPLVRVVLVVAIASGFLGAASNLYALEQLATSRPAPVIPSASASLPRESDQERPWAPQFVSGPVASHPAGRDVTATRGGALSSPAAVSQQPAPTVAGSATPGVSVRGHPMSDSRILSDFASPDNPGPTAPPPETWTQQGVINWAAESHGPDYLALPLGPGHRVSICGPAACITIVSTDAGPDRAMQRAGRIADLAVGLWERIAGVDRRYGATVGTWTLVP